MNTTTTPEENETYSRDDASASLQGMKLIARDQWVGDGLGYYIKRDLWEDKNGRRVSIRKGEGIWRN